MLPPKIAHRDTTIIYNPFIFCSPTVEVDVENTVGDTCVSDICVGDTCVDVTAAIKKGYCYSYWGIYNSIISWIIMT